MKIRITPGANPDKASLRLATLIVNKWMPGNAGGVHVICTPQLSKLLHQFFVRSKQTDIAVSFNGITPVISEIM